MGSSFSTDKREFFFRQCEIWNSLSRDEMMTKGIGSFKRGWVNLQRIGLSVAISLVAKKKLQVQAVLRGNIREQPWLLCPVVGLQEGLSLWDRMLY